MSEPEIGRNSPEITRESQRETDRQTNTERQTEREIYRWTETQRVCV